MAPICLYCLCGAHSSTSGLGVRAYMPGLALLRTGANLPVLLSIALFAPEFDSDLGNHRVKSKSAAYWRSSLRVSSAAMKYILPAIILSLTVGLTSAWKAPQALGRSAETCGDPADAVPLYRLYSPSLFSYTYLTDITTVNAIIKQTFMLELVSSMVFVTQEESTVPSTALIIPLSQTLSGPLMRRSEINSSPKDTPSSRG
ncbi:hypothetical protein B0H13DRAFT_1875235 [Mycena leptocephala]|nr:hypothetical protein B0H13DRAFT_1875235 [Mycena leptocephala]